MLIPSLPSVQTIEVQLSDSVSTHRLLGYLQDEVNIQALPSLCCLRFQGDLAADPQCIHFETRHLESLIGVRASWDGVAPITSLEFEFSVRGPSVSRFSESRLVALGMLKRKLPSIVNYKLPEGTQGFLDVREELAHLHSGHTCIRLFVAITYYNF